MSGFSAQWLALREPCDIRARSEDLNRLLAARLQDRPLHAMDLGCGTGSNIRYLAPRLGGQQHWLAVDDDPAHITDQAAGFQGEGYQCRISPQRLDLAGGLDALPWDRCQLVSGSALLDLVSGPWLGQLAGLCAGAGAVVAFALTYDGRMGCSPTLPDDEWIRHQINRHQHGDKGFGAALGPAAVGHARKVFAAHGYTVHSADSDWVIEPDERELQTALVEGWAAAAMEIALTQQLRVQQWRDQRLAWIEAGQSRLRVGHQDFIGWLVDAGSAA